MELVDYNGHQLRRWRKGVSDYLVCPEKGARLMSWSLGMADGSFRDVIHWPENADFNKIESVRGGNPILFPFSGRTFSGSEIGKWKAADGIVRPMPMHGFVRNGSCSIENVDDLGFTSVLKPDEAAQEAYPYDYKFSVAYKFYELKMVVDFILENNDNQAIPWSPGHHFYFNLPWHSDLQRSDYRVNIPAKKAYYHAPDGSLSEVKDWNNEETFDCEGLNDRLHSRMTGDCVKFGPKGGEEDISIKIITPGVKGSTCSIVTWSETENEPYYCVEPWFGLPNGVSRKGGVSYVSPGKSSRFTVEVSLM